MLKADIIKMIDSGLDAAQIRAILAPEEPLPEKKSGAIDGDKMSLLLDKMDQMISQMQVGNIVRNEIQSSTPETTGTVMERLINGGIK